MDSSNIGKIGVLNKRTLTGEDSVTLTDSQPRIQHNLRSPVPPYFIFCQVEMECSEEDIYTITGYDFDWKRVGRRLIGDQNTTDIDKEGGSEGDKRERMLLQWKRSKAREATYGALVKVLRALENNATADRVEELERKSRTSQGNIKLTHQHCMHVQVNLLVW